MKLSTVKIEDSFFTATFMSTADLQFGVPKRATLFTVRGSLKGVEPNVEVVIDDNKQKLCEKYVKSEILKFLGY